MLGTQFFEKFSPYFFTRVQEFSDHVFNMVLVKFSLDHWQKVGGIHIYHSLILCPSFHIFISSPLTQHLYIYWIKWTSCSIHAKFLNFGKVLYSFFRWYALLLYINRTRFITGIPYIYNSHWLPQKFPWSTIVYICLHLLISCVCL